VITEQEVRDLCRRVIQAKDPSEFRSMVSELHVALREHIQRIENLGLYTILKGFPKISAGSSDGTGD